MKTLALLLICLVFAGAKVHLVHDKVNASVPVKSWIEFKNEGLTRQHFDYSCGSASLSTILTYYYDQNVTEKEILDAVLKMKGLHKHSSLEAYKKANGLSFLDLSLFAFRKGFRAMGVALDLKALQKLKIPVIVYVKIRNNEHFTVLKGIDDRYAYLADPSFGNTKIKIAKFKEMFYQREDVQYPGKVLIVFPPKEVVAPKRIFTKVPQGSNLIENVIRSRMIKY